MYFHYRCLLPMLIFYNFVRNYLNTYVDIKLANRGVYLQLVEKHISTTFEYYVLT